ncbi:STAS domain-containing protein [Akkermansiaceae bacterium]|nr:STAS domain-containing protein [Akkermansiaceae bacterium]MDB4537015.1 STAS domain-containing protein [Akkermansiaceae bacterium]MDB4544849.1 STAS domain-containing protein [Akkermansiaceae bacterium]
MSKKFESYVWIRPEGRGTFKISPSIKEFGESRIAAGQNNLVVDLGACVGMDSTFMGMLAGLGMLLKKKGEGQLSIVGTTDKTRASLEELGLNHLMEIEPKEGPWVGHLDEARSDLKPLDAQTSPTKEDHILESHENLCEADSENFDRFKTVLGVMGSKKVNPLKSTPD